MNGRKGDNIRQAVPFVRQITQDGKPKLEVYRPTTNPIYYYTQVSNHLSFLSIDEIPMSVKRTRKKIAYNNHTSMQCEIMK